MNKLLGPLFTLGANFWGKLKIFSLFIKPEIMGVLFSKFAEHETSSKNKSLTK